MMLILGLVVLIIYIYKARVNSNPFLRKGCVYMEKLIYDTRDCMNLIKKKYPYIPRWIIKRILYAEELYMFKIGIICYIPDIDNWN